MHSETDLVRNRQWAVLYDRKEYQNEGNGSKSQPVKLA